MTEYYAQTNVLYGGGDKIFSIPFPYIKKDHIKVFIDNEEITNYTYNNSSQITINATINVGQTVSIRRTTPIDARMVVFSDNSILDKDAQNLSANQLFYAFQELADSYGISLDELLSIYSQTVALLDRADDVLDAAELINQAAQASADRAEQYADSAEFGMKWMQFSIANWEAVDNKYQLSLSDVPVVNGVYKGSWSDKELVANCDIEITSNGCVITSLEAFNGFILAATSVLGIYEYEQTLASDEWIIDHNTGYYPCVTLVDDNGIVMVGTVQYVTLNRIKVTFTEPVTGKAYLR